MPKVGGNTIQECMSICVGDSKTVEEYPDTEKRSEVCYAACAGSMTFDESFEVTAEDGKYIINGEINPNLTLVKGMSYNFEINAEGHPFLIKTSQSTGLEDLYEDGVKNNGVQDDTLIFEVPLDAPNTLYYNCQFHDTMKGEIKIVNESEMSLLKLIKKYK